MPHDLSLIHISTDEDRMFVDLNGFSYKDRTKRLIKIERCWYEDEHGNEVEPDTITGEFSDMPHVLSLSLIHIYSRTDTMR